MSRLDPLSRESLAPSLTDAALAEARVAFRERGVAQIDDFLAAESAAALHGFLEHNTSWQHVVTFGEDAYDLDLAEASAHERARHELLVAAAQRRARDGFQFAYQNARVSNEPAERRTRDWPIDRLLDALNSPATLALFPDRTR